MQGTRPEEPLPRHHGGCPMLGNDVMEAIVLRVALFFLATAATVVIKRDTDRARFFAVAEGRACSWAAIRAQRVGCSSNQHPARR